VHAIYSLRGDKELKQGLIAPQLMSGIWKLKIEVGDLMSVQIARRRHEVCNFPVGVSTIPSTICITVCKRAMEV